MLKHYIDSLRTIVSAAHDRMHVMHAQGNLNLKELLAVQYEISAACDHLELASNLADLIDHANDISFEIEEDKKPSDPIDEAWDKKVSDEMDSWTKDSHPDNNDRDAGRICDQCNHDLELNADLRCTRCGAQS